MPNPAAQGAPTGAQHDQPTPAVPAKAPDNVGKTPVAPGTGSPDKGAGLPMPHERDESLSTGDDAQRAVMDQARKDIEAGQVDTDMRATPGQDATRRDQLLSHGHSGGQPPGKPSR